MKYFSASFETSSLCIPLVVCSAQYRLRIVAEFSRQMICYPSVATPRSGLSSYIENVCRLKQSKSNLDSATIKASATSHFTIRWLHTLYSTYEVCIYTARPSSTVRYILSGRLMGVVIFHPPCYPHGKSLIEYFDDAASSRC